MKVEGPPGKGTGELGGLVQSFGEWEEGKGGVRGGKALELMERFFFFFFIFK